MYALFHTFSDPPILVAYYVAALKTTFQKYMKEDPTQKSKDMLFTY